MKNFLDALVEPAATRRINLPEDDDMPTARGVGMKGVKELARRFLRTPSMDAHADDVKTMMTAAGAIAAEKGGPATAAEISRATGIDERDAAGVVAVLKPGGRDMVTFTEDGPVATRI